MHDIFAFTDIHGMYNLFQAIMNYCNKQDPEAMIIFCGDACDRGPDGYKIMKELLNNPKVVYLKGNHEDMFTKAAREIKEKFSFKGADKERIHKVLNACKHFDYKYAAIQDSLHNGGMPTLMEWIMDGMPIDFVEQIEKLPLTFSTDTCDFCHAAGSYKTFMEVANAEYENKIPDEYSMLSILWSRTAYELGWAPNRTVIYGHTPVPYLLEDLKVKFDKDKRIQPYKYVGTLSSKFTGPKIDMDTGACFTKVAYVLNVLTMKAIGFEIKNDGIEEIEAIQM